MNPATLNATVREHGGSITTNGKCLRLRWMTPLAADDRAAWSMRTALEAQVTIHRKALYRFFMELG